MPRSPCVNYTHQSCSCKAQYALSCDSWTQSKQKKTETTTTKPPLLLHLSKWYWSWNFHGCVPPPYTPSPHTLIITLLWSSSLLRYLVTPSLHMSKVWWAMPPHCKDLFLGHSVAGSHNHWLIICYNYHDVLIQRAHRGPAVTEISGWGCRTCWALDFCAFSLLPCLSFLETFYLFPSDLLLPEPPL